MTPRPFEAWSGRLAFGPWWLLYVGPVGPTEIHAHHAFQIVAAPVEGAPSMGTADIQVAAPFLVIPADAPHQFGSTAARVAVLFIDPECSSAATLRQLLGSSSPCSWVVDVPTLALGDPISAWLHAEVLAHAMLKALENDHARPPVDRRVRHPAVEQALALLPDIVAAGRLQIDVLARQVGLSPSRFSHVFSHEVGAPPRSYVRWLRLITASEAIAQGASFTDAAHRAGFADGAHFTRTFRSMFGLSPSEALGLGDWLLR